MREEKGGNDLKGRRKRKKWGEGGEFNVSVCLALAKASGLWQVGPEVTLFSLTNSLRHRSTSSPQELF